MDPESSFELLGRVRNGDNDALDRLLRRYLPSLTRWAGGRLPKWARDMSDTQDLVQDTLIQALKHIGTFEYRHEGALQAYLRQAVMNRIRDEVRRAHRRPPPMELEEGVPSASASPLEDAIGAEVLDRYEGALARLTAEDREAIIARVELRQSYQDVALALGKAGPDAARMAVNRALVRLAEHMKA